MYRYQIGDCFYTSPQNGVFLYHALDTEANLPVILKYVKIQDAAAFEVLRKEGDNQIRLNQHPFICKVYNFTSMTDQSTSPPTLYMVLALEQCTQDLDKLWSSRSGSRAFFDESYLWSLVYECVEALAYAQDFVSSKQDICHRDIKPANILLGVDEHVRICDFGSSKHIQPTTADTAFTLQGTPEFLSPKQREHLKNFLNSGQLSRVNHDPYKSDVYSLGYTFLVLSLLRTPVLVKGSQNTINAEVQTLTYSQLYKEMIAWMMCVDEDNRPNFQTLRGWLRPYFVPSTTNPSTPPPSCIIHQWHIQSTDTRDPPIVLDCNPTHIICSAHCFREFVFTATQLYSLDIDAVICPICSSPISPVLIYQAYGSEREFEKERERLLGACVCGSESHVRRRFKCRHHLCRACWRRHNKPELCPDCKALRAPTKSQKNCEVF